MLLFDRKDNQVNERIIYQTKPSIFFGCKKAIYGIVLLVIVFKSIKEQMIISLDIVYKICINNNDFLFDRK